MINVALLALSVKGVGQSLNTKEETVWEGEVDWAGPQPEIIMYTNKHGAAIAFMFAYSRHNDGPDNGTIVHYYRQRTWASVKESGA